MLLFFGKTEGHKMKTNGIKTILQQAKLPESSGQFVTEALQLPQFPLVNQKKLSLFPTHCYISDYYFFTLTRHCMRDP